MIKNILTIYNPLKYATVIVYMLQNTDYRSGPYLAWFWRTQHFDRVMYRRALDYTKIAKALRAALIAGMALQILVAFCLIVIGIQSTITSAVIFGLAMYVAVPIVWAHLVAIPLFLGRWLIVVPRDARLARRAEQIFRNHQGAKIAIAGSYGKTTMKELLTTVLSEGKTVAATPGNMNVVSSQAKFAASLSGDEDIVIIEYGEAKPGDVAGMTQLTHPTHAVITGLAPAHLDRYKTVERAAHDILSVSNAIEDKSKVYVNTDSNSLANYVKDISNFTAYSGASGVGSWRPKNITVTASGLTFDLVSGKKKLRLHSGLLGAHQVGPISAVAVLGISLGLTLDQIEHGVEKTVAFEHRMQPRQLGGATIIDDTYNGNLEGIRVGTELLGTVEAKRKWYVTPGLVGQGKETARVHVEAGQLIAQAKPDIVVLMQNSTTKHIQKGLDEAGYEGEVRIETDPLAFYTNLEHFIAAGDVVLMQNDWTDNYA